MIELLAVIFKDPQSTSITPAVDAKLHKKVLKAVERKEKSKSFEWPI